MNSYYETRKAVERGMEKNLKKLCTTAACAMYLRPGRTISMRQREQLFKPDQLFDIAKYSDISAGVLDFMVTLELCTCHNYGQGSPRIYTLTALGERLAESHPRIQLHNLNELSENNAALIADLQKELCQ